MPISRTAVQYLVPCSCACKSIKTQTNNTGFTWTRSWIELRNCSWFRCCWCTIRRYLKSGKSGLGRSVGHFSSVYLDCSILSVSCRKRTNWIWCQTTLCVKSQWQLEPSRHSLLNRVFLTWYLTFPNRKGSVSWIMIKAPSLTALAMDMPMACIWPFRLSSSPTRTSSSAVEFSHSFNHPPLESNLLEYLPEASRSHNATAAYARVEEVPLQATPEGLKFFLDDQCLVRELCCRQHTFVAPIPLWWPI